MPLHELYRMAKGKVDHKEMNITCVADQSSVSKNDLFELVWENGQISMQGQSSSNRATRKSPSYKNLPSHYLASHIPKGQDKELGYANETNTRMGKFGDSDTGLNEITRPVPSDGVDLSKDKDMIHWLNYGIDDSLHHGYSSGFLHELSGVTMNDVPALNKFSLLDRINNCNQVFRDSHKYSPCNVLNSEQWILSKGSSAVAGEVESAGPKVSTSQLYPPSLLYQCHTSFASTRSRESDIAENNTSNAVQNLPCGEISQIPSASNDGFSSLKMERQDPIMSNNSSTIMNFSHFAKPAAIVKANLHSIGFSSGLFSRSESVEIKDKGAAATRSNPLEPKKVDLSNECPKKSDINIQQVTEPSKVDLKLLEPKPLVQDAAVTTKADPAGKDVSKIDQTSNQAVGESGRKGPEAVENNMEPAVVSSSVCSGNGAERGSDDPNQTLKRKSRDTEDSECHSEDVEEESVGIKKVAHARGRKGSKRNRSAEVHNLSERRRRDRINEKMRALQELIPNCNKVDKASMLDEAIEYLKTLQRQLQVMSMGCGLYMPTMMLPAGMQHMHAPHVAPFSPMGVGMPMGLGVGYGMGMSEVQLPQMQGAHLPIPLSSGSTALHGMARPSPQIFGLPGQGLSTSVPCAPIFSFPGEPLMTPSALGLNACGTSGLMKTKEPASASSLKNPMPNVSSQVMQNDNGCNSANPQCEATAGGFEPSILVHNRGHASLNDKGAVDSDKEDNLATDKSCYD